MPSITPKTWTLMRPHTSQNTRSVSLSSVIPPTINLALLFFKVFYGCKDETSVRVMQMVVLELDLCLYYCFVLLALRTTTGWL